MQGHEELAVEVGARQGAPGVDEQQQQEQAREQTRGIGEIPARRESGFGVDQQHQHEGQQRENCQSE
ncbi:hypothetical protein D3C80_2207680 [compost metagenome]